MHFKINKLQSSDVTLAQQLIALWQRDDGIFDGKLPGNAYLSQLLSADSFHAYVALDGDTVVGGLTAYELPMFGKEVRELFLYEIGVTESHWRQGIARALIEALQQTYLERGVGVIFVGTEMDNDAAKQLYANTCGTLKVIARYEYEL